jgi:hypothetical protein
MGLVVAIDEEPIGRDHVGAVEIARDASRERVDADRTDDE